MLSWADHWPIVDPTIPPRDKRRILDNRDLMGMTADSFQRYNNPRTSGGQHGWLIASIAVVSLGLLPAASAAIAEASLAGMIIIALIAVAAIVFFIWVYRESPGRLARLYRHRYVIPNDLDNEAHALFKRAADATVTVSWSEVSKRGFLDSVANNAIFPYQLWEISRLLRFQAALRAEQAAAVRGVVLTRELAAVLAPQQQALQHSVAVVTQRIVELEAYACRVQEADSALRAHEQLQNNEKYRYLLAHTDDSMGMQSLLQQSAIVQNTLTRSVQEAISAGQTLAVPDLRRWH